MTETALIAIFAIGGCCVVGTFLTLGISCLLDSLPSKSVKRIKPAPVPRVAYVVMLKETFVGSTGVIAFDSHEKAIRYVEQYGFTAIPEHMMWKDPESDRFLSIDRIEVL